jgi:hypothetical protein
MSKNPKSNPDFQEVDQAKQAIKENDEIRSRMVSALKINKSQKEIL